MKEAPRQVPKWMNRLFKSIKSQWNHHGPCNSVSFTVDKVESDDGFNVYHIIACPVTQEIYGGEEDGKIVWTGFIFEVADWLKIPGIQVDDFAVGSLCVGCEVKPRFMMKGKFEGRRIFLEVLLEPQDEKVVEVIDSIRKKVIRKKEETNES
jgi:hypothetical protein